MCKGHSRFEGLLIVESFNLNVFEKFKEVLRRQGLYINVMVSWWKVTLHTIENSSTTNKGARVQSGDV